MGVKDTPSSELLLGKVALVTGASKGIGSGIARALADAGASVVCSYLGDHEGAERLVGTIEANGGRALAVRADVSVVSDIEALFVRTLEAWGRLDIVVNNAAVFDFAPIERTTDQMLRDIVGTNLVGTIMVCRTAVRSLGRGGSIINIGSMSIERYAAGALAYTASKAGLTGVTGVLAVELGPRGIRVNQINPGAVDTEGARRIGAMTDEARAVHASNAPLGRVGAPADIGAVAVFLASDAARWITGECIAVSGGYR
jgi:3-oxoacyl-[acyl-carrier protein] reductase